MLSVIEKKGNKERTYNLDSYLFQNRILFLTGQITEEMGAYIVKQLLVLEALDPKADIQMYIDSPGGVVTAGMGIYDTMKNLKCDVSTICVGMAASMAAVLLAAGTPGKRYSLEHSSIMIHQVLGGAQGQASDIEIAAKNISKTKNMLNELLADMTGRPFSKIAVDTDRDYYMTAKEAKAYGLIDDIII